MKISLVSVSIKYWWSSNSAHFIVSHNYTVREGDRARRAGRGGQRRGKENSEGEARGKRKTGWKLWMCRKDREGGEREMETEGERWQAYNMFYELKSCSSISFIPLASIIHCAPGYAYTHTHLYTDVTHTHMCTQFLHSPLTSLIGCNVDWQLLGGIRALIGDSVDCLWRTMHNGQLLHLRDISDCCLVCQILCFVQLTV